MSTEYLKDTENIVIDKKVSSLIEGQFPEFLRNEGSEFVDFLQTYYQWLETSELTISDQEQNEFKFVLEDDSHLLYETNEKIVLESTRETANTLALSTFSEGETITGQTSGATATVDRDLTSGNNKIFTTDIGRTHFKAGETILGSDNRTVAKVTTFFKNPLFSSRSLLKNRDVDTVDTSLLDQFKKEFLSSYPDTLSVDKRFLLKHITDLYRAKGSQYSFDLFFKSVYNVQDLDYYRPKDDILVPSSGDWNQPSSLRIITSDTNDKFASRSITGQTSGATAIVDSVQNFVSGALTVTELELLNISGTFVVGETIVSSEYENNTGSGICQGVLTKINITNAGTNYKVGDVVTISGGGGQDAAARISQIGTGAITGFSVFDPGDGYINGTALSVNNFATGGDGVAGQISKTAHTFTVSINDDVIKDFTAITIDADEFGLSGDITANRGDRIIDALGFSKSDIGSITSVRATGLGFGYELSPIISITEPSILTFNESAVGILNLNDDPDSIESTTAITDTFTPSERFTSNSGNKIGTFLGTVSTASTIDDPTRIRFRPIQYTGTFGSGRNDLVANTSAYVNPTIPTVYDVQVKAPTFSGSSENTNQFVFRRGINAQSVTESTNTSTTIEYTATGTDITGGFQKLQFPVTSIARSSTTATVTTPKKHGLDDGQKVILSGASPTGYNGEKTITVTGATTFTYTITGSPSTPASGTIVYDENVAVKFTLPFGHKADDRFLISAVDFASNEVITGFESGASATVNTGTAVADGGIRGNNAIVDVAGLAAGSVKEIEITNFGVGYTTSPTLSLADKGGGNANLSANIGAIGVAAGTYADENGRVSSAKRLQDSYYYQNYSYSLRNKQQLNDYEKVVKKLLHPSGHQLFGEFRPDAPNLQLGVDHLLTSEDGDTFILESGDNILMEQYFEPSHSISLDKIQSLTTSGNGGVITVTGGSKFVISDVGRIDELTLEDGLGNLILDDSVVGTGGESQNFLLETSSNASANLSADFSAGDKIIIDDEQAFEVSYGEFLLEKQLTGTLNSSSTNVLSYVVLTNTSSSFTVGETVFQGELDALEFDNDGGTNSSEIVVGQLTLEDSGGVLKSETNELFLLESTADAVNSETSGLVLLETSNSKITDTMLLEIQTNTATGTVNSYFTDASNNKILVLSTTSGDFSLSSNANGSSSGATANITSFSKNLIFGVGTDFEDELSTGQVITVTNTRDSFEVSSIINSSAIIGNTTIGNGITTTFDNSILNKIILESSVRGTTSANGLNDGSTTVTGTNTFFSEDLLVNDVISLSTNTTLKAQVTSISSDTSITVNTSIGDGTNSVSITLHSRRNLDLEASEDSLTLSRPYDGSNNFMGINDTTTTTGFLLFEDGIGILNVLYTSANTSSGKLQLQELSTFSNVEPKLITS